MREKIYLSSPTMHGDGLKFIQDAFDSNWVAPLGANVTGFEEDICNYTKAKFALSMSTGTAAIHMALRYLGVGSNDVVFCQSLTFVATCNPIIYQNAKPVFIDSEPDTWNMSPQALEKAFKKYLPKAVIVVHLYGTPAKMDEIKELCEKYKVSLIEDAAESLGGFYKGKHTGTIGNFGILSFNGNKIITTSGGGMILCDNQEEQKKIAKWITQSRDDARHYEHSELGFNYRMSNICAGIGRGQMLHLEQHVSLKKSIYEYYQNAFKEIPEITMNPLNPDGDSNYWISCMTIDQKSKVKPEDILVALEKENIEGRPIWKPMHAQPLFSDTDFFTHNESGESVSDDLFRRGLCLPSDIKMSNNDLEQIVSIVKKVFNN